MIEIIRKNWLGLFIILILAAGLLSGIYLIKRQQIIKGRAQEYSIDQLSTPATRMLLGFNVKGLVHYGYNDVYKDIYNRTSSDYLDKTLEQIQDAGGRVVRIWVANNNISDEEVADRLDRLLTKGGNYGLSFLISLINYYSTGNYPKNFDTARFYSSKIDSKFTADTGFSLLSDDFFAGGWRGSNQGSFEHFIDTVVSRNKNHKNIYAWEIGNELKETVNSENMISFIRDVCNKIKSNDLYHKVTPGFLNSYHALNLGPGGVIDKDSVPNKLYGGIKDCIDYVSVISHNGQRTEGQELDLAWANRNKKDFIVSEAGLFHNAGIVSGYNRSNYYNQEMRTWASQGAKAYLLWAFANRETQFSNGDLDDQLGIDNYFHARDYEPILNVVKDMALSNRPARTLMQVDFSNNPDFLNNESNTTLTIPDPDREQTIMWDHTKLYIRSFYQEEGSTGLVKNTHKYKVENDDGFKTGNVYIIVKP